MRFHDLEYKEVIWIYHFRIHQPAFKIGIAFFYEGCIDFRCLNRGQVECFELVRICPSAIPDPDNGLCHVDCWYIDDTLFAFTDHVKTVIARGDHAADQGRREFQHRMPAHRHDILLPLVSGTDQYHRTWLEQLADSLNGEIAFLVFLHVTDIVRP